MIEKTLEKIPVSELIPYENNPRLNENAVEDVMESIRQCENLDPIEIDEDNVILAGHTRRLALKRMGVKETEVIRYTGLTEEQKKKYRLLSNKTNEKSLWDFDKLEAELTELDFEGFDFGFGIDEMFDKIDKVETQIEEERKGSLKERYLVPPFSIIYANKPDWLKRKRMWVDFGIRSELGRSGKLAYNTKKDIEANFVGGVQLGKKQSLQEQQPIKQLHDKSKAFSDGLIERREQIRKQRNGRSI